MGFGFCMCVLVCDLQSRLPVWPLPLKQSGAFQGTAWFLSLCLPGREGPLLCGPPSLLRLPFPREQSAGYWVQSRVLTVPLAGSIAGRCSLRQHEVELKGKRRSLRLVEGSAWAPR